MPLLNTLYIYLYIYIKHRSVASSGCRRGVTLRTLLLLWRAGGAHGFDLNVVGFDRAASAATAFYVARWLRSVPPEKELQVETENRRYVG